MGTRRSRFLPPLVRATLPAPPSVRLEGGSAGPSLRKAMGWLVLGSALAVGPAEAATFVVDSITDGADAALDGVCQTAAPPRCTLRAAIEEANFAVGPTTINFSINPAGAKTIVLGSALPQITKVVIINGTTQPGWVAAGSYPPVIELNGAATGGAGGSGYGLDLQPGSSGSTVRGLCINRCPARAIRIQESSNNVIAGNFLGTNLAGTAAGPGNSSGIFIGSGASATVTNNNRIGGTAAADRNVISSNTVDGIQMNGGTGGDSNNVVEGNYIGVDVTGTVDLGNASQGVAIYNTLVGPNTNNRVGGTAVGAGNVISGNGGDGIRILAAGTTGTLVQGNKIGTNAAGTAGIPNGAGVRVDTGTSNNTIGGTAANAGNTIAFNNPGNTLGLGGVYLTAAAGTGNSILGNKIYSNGGLGIDLNEDGVTANDPLDPDTGPNNLLNFPVIGRAFFSAGTLTLNVKLDLPLGDYRIEFFKNPTFGADPSGYGEGETLVSAQTFHHPGGGTVNFAPATFAGAATDVITATATVCNNAACALAPSPAFGSTSEFSKAMLATTTSVTLMSFTAVGGDGAVDVSWATASELENLGFHLYRSLSSSGPFTRITSAVIPGLGSSAAGQGYSYHDAGLTNGATYFYKLEDIDTSGVTTLHGPVSATPTAASKGGGDDPSSGPGNSGTPHGDPAATSLNVLERDSQHLLLELRTGGFYTTPNPDGSVEIAIPGFDERSSPGDPALPSRHTWIEATAGKKVQITSVQASDPVSFPGLHPSPAAVLAMDVTRNGIVRPARTPRHESATFRRGLFPRMIARVLGIGFQEETKKAEVELAPLRFNALSETLVLSRRLLVRLDFLGVDRGEVSLGGTRGRKPIELPPLQNVAAQLVVHEKGLYGVSFADLFGRGGTAVPVSALSLTLKGQPVAFHVDRASFGPGASLYFRSATLDGDTREAVYELTRKTGGRRMTTASAAPSGAETPYYFHKIDLEQNKTYQSGLLDAPDLWLWDVLVSPVTRNYPFTVDHLASTSESAHLTVWLQGASDFDVSPDHHLRVSVNGTPMGEASWDGKEPRTIEADVTPGVLVEGQNELEIENVGDTLAAYSMVILDRFALSYPRRPFAVNGSLEGTVSDAGTVEVSGLGPGSMLLDTTTDALPRWLTGLGLGTSGLRFRAEAGHRYLAVAPTALLRPEVRRPAPGHLREARNRADYLLIGPRAFLATAQPLIDLRQSQGLRTRAVAVEDVYDQFGFGEARPEAIKAFLAYAYHYWQRPSVRYVLLLGDATYDPNDYLHTGVVDRVPALMVKTSYLWTASDPAYAAVNGDDSLPDLALGRLPAETVEEARVMVDKIVAFETSGRDFSGSAVMVADNADIAGDFEGDADDVAATSLSGRTVEKVYLRDLGAFTRPAIQNALDNGPSIVNYIGHGGIAVWASENIWNNLDVQTLAPQEQLPLLFTMNCLNGYFHFPNLNSLAEQFLKAEGKGAIAAFAPSGLSVDAPAHAYHKLVLAEITSGRHARLGDAVLAAQNAYAASGDFPELLSIYHLFGDPAQKIR